MAVEGSYSSFLLNHLRMRREHLCFQPTNLPEPFFSKAFCGLLILLLVFIIENFGFFLSLFLCYIHAQMKIFFFLLLGCLHFRSSTAHHFIFCITCIVILFLIGYLLYCLPFLGRRIKGLFSFYSF